MIADRQLPDSADGVLQRVAIIEALEKEAHSGFVNTADFHRKVNNLVNKL